MHRKSLQALAAVVTISFFSALEAGATEKWVKEGHGRYRKAGSEATAKAPESAPAPAQKKSRVQQLREQHEGHIKEAARTDRSSAGFTGSTGKSLEQRRADQTSSNELKEKRLQEEKAKRLEHEQKDARGEVKHHGD